MQVGKTTCADYLVGRYGYVRTSLADPIKDIARQGFGWDGQKDERGRRLLQDLGTAGRAYDPALWLRRFDEWFLSHGEGPVVVDDVRLLNEVVHLERLGFLSVLIVRESSAARPVDSLGEHETETELDRAKLDLVIVNSGTIADLHRALDEVLATST